ncbi:MAG: hypothetical protein R2705_01315 [Ilumatobacteraceae bacterium]
MAAISVCGAIVAIGVVLFRSATLPFGARLISLLLVVHGAVSLIASVSMNDLLATFEDGSLILFEESKLRSTQRFDDVSFVGGLSNLWLMGGLLVSAGAEMPQLVGVGAVPRGRVLRFANEVNAIVAATEEPSSWRGAG